MAQAVVEEKPSINGFQVTKVVNLTGNALSESGVFLRGLDVLHGKIYVADRNKNSLYSVTCKGNTFVESRVVRPDFGLSTPDGIITDVLTENLIISDSYNHRILLYSPTTGNFQVLCGHPGTAKKIDGTLADARFYYPKGIAIDKHGIIYVSESSHCVRRIDRQKNVVTTVAGTARGYKDGFSHQALFDWPCAVEVDNEGNLYVADKNNSCIRFVDVAKEIVTTLVGSPFHKGHIDGPFESARFKEVFDLKLDKTQRYLWICDSGNKVVRKLDLKFKLVSTLQYTFQLPRGMLFESTHNLLVTDASLNAIFRVVLKTPLTWKCARVLWIGKNKEKADQCNLAKLPRELIFEIIHIANDLPDPV